MRRLGLLITLATAGALSAAGPATAANGPIAHWRFDEASGATAADAAGNGNTGTLQGGVGWISGARLGAVQFDGTGLVRVPSSATLEPATVTVSAGVRRSGSPGAYKYVVGKGAFACLTSSYGLYTGPDGGLAFYVSDGAAFTRSPDAGTSVWDGEWHHVAGTFDGQALRIYVDGAEIGAGTPRTSPITYTMQDPTDLLLGDYGGCGGLNYDGALDEAKIFNRALTAGEVKADSYFEFKGFFSPVDNPSIVNVVKAGSAVPLKWSLTGYQGMGILAAGSPSSRVAACDSSATDELEVTAAAGSNTLSYDAASDRYSYVWKTEKSWVGCRELALRLSDGSVHMAEFRFK